MISLLRSYRDFARICAANFLFFLNYAAFFGLPRWWDAESIRESTIGSLMAAAGIVALVEIAYLVRRIDHSNIIRQFQIGAIVLAASSMVFWVLPLEAPYLYAVRICHGLAFGLAFTASSSMVPKVVPRKRLAEAMGYFGVFTLVTHGIAPAVAEFGAQDLGYRWVYGAMGLSSVAALVVSLRWPKFKNRSDAIGEPDAVRRPKPVKVASQSLQALLSSSIAVLYLTFAIGASFGLLVAFLPVWAQQNGVVRGSAFFAAYALCAIFVRIRWGYLSDHGDRSKQIFLAGAAVAIGLVATGMLFVRLVSVLDWVLLAIIGAVYGVGHGFFYPAANVQFVSNRSESQQSSGMSLFLMTFNLGITCSMLLSGLWIEQHGYSSAFVFCGVLTGAALVRYGWIHKRQSWVPRPEGNQI